MDTRRLIIAMALALGFMFAWEAFVRYQWMKHPEWQRPQSTEEANKGQAGTQSATQSAAESATRSAAQVAAGPASGPAGSMTAQAGTMPSVALWRVVGAPSSAPPMGVILGSDDKTIPLVLAVSPDGAGVDSVTLKDFTKEVKKPDPYVFQHRMNEEPAYVRSLATRWVKIDGQAVDLWSAAWQVEGEASARSVTYFVDVGRGEAVVRVRRRYEVTTRGDKGQGYEVLVTQSFENRGGSAVKVRAMINGPLMPIRELDNWDDRQVVAGYWDEGVVTVGHNTVSEFTPKETSKELIRNKAGQRLLWAGMSSVYFEAIVRPDPMPEHRESQWPLYMASVKAEALNPGDESDKRQVVMTFETEDLEVKPGAGSAVSLPMRVFFGPKKRSVVESAYYSAAPLGYDGTLRTTSSGCGTWCTFGWLITALVGLLRGFQFVLRDWGLAIIALVVVVRVVLHPITKRSQISMQKMGKMGPEMEKLKKKYGDDKDELNKAMMSFYKEQGFTPILGCLPMFLQMPIWVALWSALQNTFELRHSPFLWFGPVHLTWIADLAKPDALVKFPHSVPLPFGWHVSAINVLPLLMAVVTWVSQKYQPRPPAMTPEQEQQQKMMQYTSLIFPLLFYSMPAGLNLYYVTSMGLGIVESKRIRDHIKEQEEAEKAGRVIIDAKPTRAKKKGVKDGRGEPVKKTGLAGWIEKVEQYAKDQQGKKPKR